MKKILFTLVLFLIPNIILANEIYNINIDIYVDKNGMAHVKEKWDTYLDEGTEGYKPYYNLGGSRISNFRVSMNDKEYTFDDYYNVNGSFEEKKYLNGFNYINNGIELCFGISDYGQNTYQLNYDISNFVVNTTDGYQMIYWTLFPYNYSPSPNNVYIKIYSDFRYSDTLDVWGYGKKGAPTYVYDGYIEMNSDGKVAKDEYMTILVKFPSDAFTTTSSVDKTFDEYLKMANEGAEVYKESSIENRPLPFTFVFFSTLFVIAAGFLGFKSASNTKYGYKNNKVIKKKDVPLFRDIPCDKNIYLANTLISINNNLFSSYRETNILGAILLKWLKEDKIRLIAKGNDTESTSIDLRLSPVFDNILEKELFDFMYQASIDGILESKEFEKWTQSNYEKFLNLFKRMNNVEIEKLKINNHIYRRQDRSQCKKKNVMDDYIYEESTKLYGLKKFLDEFSNMNTKGAIEVKLWDQYLMYAYLFGIADKVAKQFKKLYPEFLQNENYNFDTLIYINHLSTRSVNAATKAQSYSSGGGGFSSGGGGGGSFGGGGGGGGFR